MLAQRHVTPALYGREAEIDQIDTLLEEARESRSGVLVLRGLAGTGKSALLDEARRRAPDMLILSCRGVESEAQLAFAALYQLVRPVLGRLDVLPPIQARALRGALGFEDDGGAGDRFLISV